MMALNHQHQNGKEKDSTSTHFCSYLSTSKTLPASILPKAAFLEFHGTPSQKPCKVSAEQELTGKVGDLSLSRLSSKRKSLGHESRVSRRSSSGDSGTSDSSSKNRVRFAITSPSSSTPSSRGNSLGKDPQRISHIYTHFNTDTEAFGQQQEVNSELSPTSTYPELSLKRLERRNNLMELSYYHGLVSCPQSSEMLLQPGVGRGTFFLHADFVDDKSVTLFLSVCNGGTEVHHFPVRTENDMNSDPHFSISDRSFPSMSRLIQYYRQHVILSAAAVVGPLKGYLRVSKSSSSSPSRSHQRNSLDLNSTKPASSPSRTSQVPPSPTRTSDI